MRPVLTILPDQTLRLIHEEVAYAPIPGDAALGALLFALNLGEVNLAAARHAEKPALRLALATARQFARILERHAGRAERERPLLPVVVSVDTARGWLLGAAEVVPAAERERFCWRAARRLGENPWGDGSPAIALHNQQFCLFEASFDDPDAAGSQSTGDAARPESDERRPAAHPPAPARAARRPRARAPRAAGSRHASQAPGELPDRLG
jgi:hypothetical protein